MTPYFWIKLKYFVVDGGLVKVIDTPNMKRRKRWDAV